MSYFCLFFYEKKQIKGHAFVFLIPWNKNKKIFRIILFWIKWRLADYQFFGLSITYQNNFVLVGTYS